MSKRPRCEGLDPEKKSQFEDYVYSTVRSHAELLHHPHGQQSPKDLHDAIVNLISGTESMLKMLEPIRPSSPGGNQGPLIQNWRLAGRVRSQYAMLVAFQAMTDKSLRVPSSEEIECYPNSLVADLHIFLKVLHSALKQYSPKRGNSAGRDVVAYTKSYLADYAVMEYRGLFGSLPSSSQDGWVACLLTDAFESGGLRPANGAYWLRQALKKYRREFWYDPYVKTEK